MKTKTKKDKIISTANKLFIKLGYENVTVNQIIEDSGVSKGTFYHYFEAKKELLGYILDEHDIEFDEFILSLPDNLPPLQRLKNFLNFVLEIYYRSTDNDITILNAKYLYKSQLDLPYHKKFILDEKRGIFRILYELVDAAISNNDFRSVLASNEIVENIMMIMRGVLFNWYLKDTRFNLVEKGNYLIQLYLDDISN